MSRRYLQVTLAALVASAAGGSPAAPQSASGTIAFDVQGRTDATPSVAADGAFVAVAWGASAEGKTDLFVAISQDGGRAFGAPVQVNRTPGEGRVGGELPPRVAIHKLAGQSVPAVTVLWNARGDATAIKMARSTDGGRTFSAPLALQSPGAIGDRGWPALALDDRGDAHAVWLDHRGLAARRVAQGGGAKAARHVHGAAASGDSSLTAQGSALFYASSSAGAVEEREITTGVCYCCKTALAAGEGRMLVAAWRHVYPGDLRDIAFAISRDGGRSFSSATRVSEDGWAINGCPDDGPALVVDAAGVTHIVWPTVIPGDEPVGALFYASSRDGQRFTPRVRIPTLGSPKPMHPQLALAIDGTLVVAWDELIEGRRVAAVRRVIRAAGAAPAFGEAVQLSPEGNASHPVLATSSAGVFAAWTSGGDDSQVRGAFVRLP
jgi:hypothetical protein